MTPRTQTLATCGVVMAALFVFAFVAAPQSCEWGLTAYFWSGVGTVVTLLAVPLILRTDSPVPRRVAVSLGFAAISLGVWVAGLFAANVRIMCRLF